MNTNQNVAAPVDVLAVMDKAVRALHRRNESIMGEVLDAARAAIAKATQP